MNIPVQFDEISRKIMVRRVHVQLQCVPISNRTDQNTARSFQLNFPVKKRYARRHTKKQIFYF